MFFPKSLLKRYMIYCTYVCALLNIYMTKIISLVNFLMLTLFLLLHCKTIFASFNIFWLTTISAIRESTQYTRYAHCKIVGLAMRIVDIQLQCTQCTGYVLYLNTVGIGHKRRNSKDTNPLMSSLLVIFVWGGVAIL
jgi:hypothetical protein